MRFGWINWINMAVVVCLILVNIIVSRKGLCGNFRSKHPVVNFFEQIGRYGCMAFVILPIFANNWKFGFRSVAEMVVWLCLTILFLVTYIFLWTKRNKGSVGILYGLAIVPVLLFLMNGILLQHPALVATSLIFGTFHLAIVKENT